MLVVLLDLLIVFDIYLLLIVVFLIRYFVTYLITETIELLWNSLFLFTLP